MEKPALFKAGGKFISVDTRLHGHWHRDQINSARGELISKTDDGLHRIGLNLVDPRAVSHLRRIKKWRTRDVIDVGPIKKPPIAAEINLFVARAEFSAEDGLNARQQPA